MEQPCKGYRVILTPLVCDPGVQFPVSYTHLDVYKRQDKAVTKGRVDVKKAASHLDDMVNMKSFKALEYANAREGFAIARDVANAAKATNQVGGATSSTGIFSKITGWLGKNSDNALIAGSQAAGKGIKGIPVLGTLLGLTASGAVVALSLIHI